MLTQRSLDYVASARVLGAGDTRIIFRHILPNSLAPVFVSITFGISGAILTESGLSFLGLGAAQPTPTWGEMLSEARERPMYLWHLATFPGIALFLGVFSYNLVGEGIRDALDPKRRQ
jgi:peptide/nickel transport system permease protein